LEEILLRRGCQVSRWESLREAYRYAQGKGRQVALVDWKLTDGLLGESDFTEFRAITQTLPIVLLIPSYWQRHLGTADLGATVLLPKPFDATRLASAVEQALQRGIARQPYAA
jgi:DNA-binding response OmpR family regulator